MRDQIEAEVASAAAWNEVYKFDQTLTRLERGMREDGPKVTGEMPQVYVEQEDHDDDGDDQDGPMISGEMPREYFQTQDEPLKFKEQEFQVQHFSDVSKIFSENFDMNQSKMIRKMIEAA